MEYPIEDQSQGLFVIIKQLTHKLNYIPDNKSDCDWSGVRQLNYEPDEKQLLDVFKLKKKTADQDQSPNLLIEQDLTSSDGGNSFEEFMDAVAAYSEKKPKFLMLFLMSHGFENGQFLLASQGMEDASGKVKSQGRCCLAERNQKHTLRGECQARNVSAVIDKICTNYPDIPKTFVIQCCRGNQANVTEKDKPDSEYVPQSPSSTELFISNHPHTLVFYACVEGNASYVTKEGSPLIQRFCTVLNQLRDDNQAYNQLLNDVEKRENVAGHLKERREDVIGGWLMNVCQRTSHLVTNFKYVELCISETKLGKILNPVATYKSIFSKDSAVRANLVQSLIKYLEKHRNASAYPEVVDAIITACKANKGANCLAILLYLWVNVRCSTKKQSLNIKTMIGRQKEDLEEQLDTLIDELREYKPYSKQQPHISSTFPKKLSCIKMMAMPSATHD